MKKIIRKVGTSAGIIFNIEEMKLNGWEIGDALDISDIVIIKIKKKRKLKQ